MAKIRENILHSYFCNKSKGKAMNRNWSNQKAKPALKTRTGNTCILQIDKIQLEHIANRTGSYFPKGGALKT